MRWDVPQDKPIIISEFGGDALQGRHGPRPSVGPRSSKPRPLPLANPADGWTVLGVSGMSPWILVDFRSPRRPLPVIQDGFNRKGLVSSEGVKKQAFFVLQRYYAAKAAAEGK